MALSRSAHRSDQSSRRAAQARRCASGGEARDIYTRCDTRGRERRARRGGVAFRTRGDGNIHVNITGIAPDDEIVTEAVLHFVARLHGSISAEHGIGTAKRRYVHLVRSADEISVYQTIKHALDPADT